MRIVQGCDWTCCDNEWVEWDDGHVPESLLRSVKDRGDGKYARTLLLRDKRYHKSTSTFVEVIDDSVPAELLHAVYEHSVNKKEPWGTYVTLEEVKQHWETKDSQPTVSQQGLPNKDDYDQHEKSISIILASEFFRHWKVNAPMELAKVLEDAHGVALWGLCSTPGSQVPYHLDYAEQLRYEYNIIVPPIAAGTLHCTTCSMKGGHLMVHTGGLDHYRHCGYKGQLRSPSYNANLKEIISVDMVTQVESAGRLDDGTASQKQQWIDVPFQAGRMILAAGHLPHLSTPVEHLEPKGTKRVVVGFNVFRNNVGSFVNHAPEHSAAFRKRINMLRLQWKAISQSPATENGQPLSVQSVQANPALASMLVRAKRQKVKDEFQKAQTQLDARIDEALQLSESVSIGELAARLQPCASSEMWPTNVTDVQVHIEQRCRQGRWKRCSITQMVSKF